MSDTVERLRRENTSLTLDRFKWMFCPSLSSSQWSSDLVDFVSKCLVKDVNERASVDELLKVSVVVMG